MVWATIAVKSRNDSGILLRAVERAMRSCENPTEREQLRKWREELMNMPRRAALQEWNGW